MALLKTNPQNFPNSIKIYQMLQYLKQRLS